MAKEGVMFMPTPGIGHLISTVELAKLLLKDSDSRFSITILTMRVPIPAWDSSIIAYIESVTSLGLRHHLSKSSLTSTPLLHEKGETLITRLIEAHKPLVRVAISSHLSSPLTALLAALILDLFCTSIIDLADEFGLPGYIYFTSTAAALSLMLCFPNYYLKDVEGE